MKSKVIVAKAGRLLMCAIIVLIAFASIASARNRRGSAESEAILPQIDVIRVKETADDAIRSAGELRREIERLNARITELDNRLILMAEDVARVSSAKIEEVEIRLALLTEAYKDLHIKVHALELAIAPAPRAAAPTGPAPTFTTTPTGIIVASPEHDLYQQALRHFNARRYDRALEMFNECAAKFPDGQFRDRVRFWIGESYYQMGNMERAIEEYRKVLAFPNSVKADAAQFQIALAHQKLGQTERSRAEFRRLIERFPASSYVERARRYLNELR
ncbi:MAG: tetratricopeptide repeat protein [Chitinispirillales bacterium]|nr:tetratricopeptide repeat protein [Chitinispirillales bacterium]